MAGNVQQMTAPAHVSSALPQEHSGFAELAASVIFPSLLFGATMVQQKSQLLASVGQIALWVSLLAAAELIIVFYSPNVFGLLVTALVGFRAAQIVASRNPALEIGYEVSNGLIFLFAGTVVLTNRLGTLERQLKKFLLVSIPVMLLQLYGKPGWIQAIRTDAHTSGSGFAHEQMLPSLFDWNESGFSTTQSRPAGVLHANNFLSIVLLFAMAVQLRRAKGRSLSTTDVLLMAVVVLSMAKIGFLAFIVFSLCYLVIGPTDARVRMTKLWGLLILFLGAFFFLFPGIFLYDLSPNNAILNYAIRVADLKAVLSGVSVVDAVQIQGIDGSQLAIVNLQAGSQSGYSVAAQYAGYLAIIVPLLALAYWHRLGAIRTRGRRLRDLSVNGVLVLLLSPLITSFAGNPFFAFALGGLAIPWVAGKSSAVDPLRQRRLV